MSDNFSLKQLAELAIQHLVKEHAEDELEAAQWMRDVSDAELPIVMANIISLYDQDDMLAKIISKFAQLGFVHAYLLAKGKKVGGPEPSAN